MKFVSGLTLAPLLLLPFQAHAVDIGHDLGKVLYGRLPELNR